MRIKKIILEGFKSYSEKVVLDGFDLKFNAITGLNGSGKSNILDAICFILGLSQYSWARVKNIAELIYNNGNKKMNIAKVTIIFDLTGLRNKPMELEKLNEIEIQRIIKNDQSHYYLNGHKETNTKIKNIFKFVGLNVDNYHTFFVKQGKITSILNFDSKNIISYLEECSGVSIYKHIKNNCNNLINKKDEKIRVIKELYDNNLENEIIKVKKEREQFILYKDIKYKIEKLKNLYDYLVYCDNEEQLTELTNDIKLNLKQKNDLEEEITKKKRKIDEFEDIKRKKIEETNKSDLCIDFKKDISNNEEELKQILMNKNSNDQYRLDSEKKIENLKIKKEKNINDINIFNNENDFNKNKLNEIQHDFNKNKMKLERYQIKFKDGVKNKNISKFLNDEKKNFENELEEILNDIKNINSNLKFEKNKLENIENNKKEYLILKNENDSNLKIYKENIINLEESLSNNNISEIDKIKRNIDDLNTIIFRKKNNQDYERLKNIFQIGKIYKNSKYKNLVMGRIINLFEIKDKQFIYAFNSMCGNKLRHIVVLNDEFIKNLPKEKDSKIETIVPNNKVHYKIINTHELTLINTIAKNNNSKVYNPLELIKVDNPDIRNSLCYAFDRTVIVDHINLGEKIQKEINVKCVTIDGDILNTNAILRGGYNRKNETYINKYEKYRNLKNEIKKLKKEKIEKSEYLKELNISLKKDNTTKKEIENIKSLIKNIENNNKNMENSEDKLELIKKNIINNEKELKEKEVKLSKINKDLKDIEDQLKDKSNNKDFVGDKFIKIKEELDLLEKEKHKIQLSQNNNDIKINEKNKENKNILKKMEKFDSELVNYKLEYQEIIKKIQKLKEIIQDKETEMNIYKENIQKKKAEKDGILLELNKYKLEYENMNREFKLVSEIITKNDEKILKIKKYWKSPQANPDNFKEFYNKPEFAFSQENFTNVEANLAKLNKEMDNIGKNFSLNVKNHNNFDEILKYYESIRNKNKIIKGDKEVLFENMNNLDEKQMDTVNRCFNFINDNIGEIFKGLLPGAYAKLFMTKKNKNINIEIKVAFNGIWKEGLSELSGGQRSLLALSFLLASLKYKPAPFYIFDEIDSALDISHTENLGKIFSTNFPESQFLIISLKEEFFKRANVIYKTSINNGRSIINRLNNKPKY